MPNANYKSQNTSVPNSAVAQGEGTWQPDLDPDYSAQLQREQKSARKQQTRVVEPTEIWQPGEAVNPDPSQRVQIDQYHPDAHTPPAIIQAAQPMGQGFTPTTIRQGTPAWVWLLTAAGLIVAILLFHQAGLYIFIIARLAILWLTKAISAANRSGELCSDLSTATNQAMQPTDGSPTTMKIMATRCGWRPVHLRHSRTRRIMRLARRKVC